MYTTLNNGIKIPMVGFGVFQIMDQEIVKETVKEAIQTGYRLIDTAQVYENEVGVGLGIKASGVSREELFIASKLWISDYSYQAAKEAFYQTLDRLGLDYLDLYLLHQPFGDVFDAWRALEELYDEGKIRAIGVSNFAPDQLANLALFSRIKPSINQIEVHVFNQRESEHDYFSKKGIQTQSWGAFAEGQFDVFNNNVLSEIAKKHHKTTAQVMLRWQLQRNIVSLSKSANPERIKQNFQIFDFELDNEDMELIKSLNTNTTVFADHRSAEVVEAFAERVGKVF